MNLVLLFLFPLVLFSGNFILSIYTAIVLIYIKISFQKLKTQYLATILFFSLLFPDSYDGYFVLLKPDILCILSTFLFLISINNKSYYLKKVKFNRPFILLISLIFFYSLFVYLPIIISTYGNNVIYGAESVYISNDRGSHMLSFALPYITSPIIALFISQIKYSYKDLKKVFKFLISLCFLSIILSFIQYIGNFNFISQNYAEVVFEGKRLTGFSNPDSNGFARSLLLPSSILLAGIIFKYRSLNSKHILFSLVFILAIYLTGSRSAFLSLIISTILMIYLSKRLKSILTISFLGFIGSPLIINLLLRNNGVFNLSGREMIYLKVIEVLISSPFVGLRPGGWITYLAKYNIASFGTVLKTQSTHSFYFETAINWGIPSIFLLVILILYVSIKSLKKLDYDRANIYLISVTCTLITLLIFGIVEIVTYSIIYLTIGLLISNINHNKIETL